MNRALRRVALLAALTSMVSGSAGCMTFDTLNNPAYDGPYTYSGARYDLDQLGPAFVSLNLFFLFFLFDLPLSAVADTFMLPRTVPLERERRAALADLLRVDRDRPAVVSSEPGEAPTAAARRLFDTCVRRLEQMSSELTDCFGVDARVQIGERSLSGSEFKPLLREALVRLRTSGDFVTWRLPLFRVTADGRVRIEAERATAQDPATRSVVLVVGPDAGGGWRVLEAQGVDWPGFAP